MQRQWWQRHMQNLTGNMKKFFIITNEHKDENLEVTHMISDYIEGKGGVCSLARGARLVSASSFWHSGYEWVARYV